jgi:hypothetical protein
LLKNIPKRGVIIKGVARHAHWNLVFGIWIFYLFILILKEVGGKDLSAQDGSVNGYPGNALRILF